MTCRPATPTRCRRAPGSCGAIFAARPGGVLAAGIDAVLHFAAKSLVGESVSRPDLYWDSNLGGTLALLEAMRAAGVAAIVFSSSAVYGVPESVPIAETAPARPISPYGASKVAVDTVLTEYARMHGLAAVSLRYFNVAGAYCDGAGAWLCERHAPETHLIPNILQIARQDAGHVAIFGGDYPTADGTCIRDYTHVTDLAAARRAVVRGPGRYGGERRGEPPRAR